MYNRTYPYNLKRPSTEACQPLQGRFHASQHLRTTPGIIPQRGRYVSLEFFLQTPCSNLSQWCKCAQPRIIRMHQAGIDREVASSPLECERCRQVDIGFESQVRGTHGAQGIGHSVCTASLQPHSRPAVLEGRVIRVTHQLLLSQRPDPDLHICTGECVLQASGLSKVKRLNPWHGIILTARQSSLGRTSVSWQVSGGA